MEFIHSVLAQNQTVVAGSVVSYDLPVNPLSHIMITVKAKQTLENLPGWWSEMRGAIVKVEVLYKGSAIYSMSGCDAQDVATLLLGFEQWGVNAHGNVGDYRTIMYLVPLGRKLYWPRECFPASTRGELILQITYGSPFGGWEDQHVQIETIEMPDAAPERYLRMTTLSVTPSAAGELDVEIPIGNPISDLILFGTTIPLAGVDKKTLTYVQVLIDNIRKFYSHANFETLHCMAGQYCQPPGYWEGHVHRLILASPAQYHDTSVNIPKNHACEQRLRIPFDINLDGEFILETAGKSDAVVRIFAGDTQPLRVIPCEIVGASRGV
ncbi:hypothetical protein ES708_03846 [subsurface metagenome]